MTEEYRSVLKLEVKDFTQPAQEAADSVKGVRAAMGQVKSFASGFLDGVLEEYRRIREEAAEASESVSDSAEQSANRIKTVVVPSLKQSFSSLTTGLKSGAMSFLRYAAGIVSLYALAGKLRTAFSAGLKGVAGYAQTTNRAVSSLTSALKQLEGSVGAAFAPLVNVAAPYITWFIRYVADGFNAVGAFFAALTGKNSYTRAVYNYKGVSDAAGDAASATHDAAEAQKELNRQLMGFDEINKLNDNSSSGSGGSNGGGGNSSGGSTGNPLSFVTESIPGGLSDAAQKLRDFFSSLDFGPLEAAWGRLTEAGGRLADIIKGGLAWGLENVLKPLAQWTIEEAAPRLVDLLANAFDILADALTILKPAWQWVWDNFLEPLAKLAADAYTAALDALNDVLEDVHGGLQDIISVMNGEMTLGELLKKWFTIPNVASLLLDLGALADKAGTLVNLATNPVALSVKLTKIGWTTLAKWVEEHTGGAVSKAVGLAKDGWSSVKDWVSNHLGGGLNKAVGLAKDGWSNVKDWVKGSFGGGLNKAIGLTKDGWSSVSEWVKGHIGKGVSVTVNLLKGWKTTVAKALGLDNLSTRFKIKLPKVKITWSKGKIPLPSFSLKWNAKGGILNGATIFGLAGNTLLGGGEAGREAVLPLESNTGWMVGSVVARKTTLKLKWPPLTMSQAATILEAIEAADFFPVAFTDMTNTRRSLTMYAGPPSFTQYSWKDGVQYVVDAAVDLIEQ